MNITRYFSYFTLCVGLAVVAGCGGGGSGGGGGTTAVPPAIVTQPASQSVPAGAPAVFAVTASGDAPLSTRLEVWAAAFSAQGARWASPTKLMTDPTARTEGGESQAPQVALNAGGDAVVVWVQRTDAAPEPSVWARVYR